MQVKTLNYICHWLYDLDRSSAVSIGYELQVIRLNKIQVTIIQPIRPLSLA